MPADLPCASLTPKVTEVYGRPVYAKLRAFQVGQGEILTLRTNLHGEDGTASDLTGCVTTVKIRIAEALLEGSTASTEVTGTIDDATNGIVSFVIPSTVTEYPGVSLCEIAGFNSGSQIVITNRLYMLVNRGQWGPTRPSGGAPTVDEIKLKLRDNGPEDNYLLDEVEFDLAEIAHAIVTCVQQFNDLPPPIDQQYNTSNFPARGYLMEGIVGHLYVMAAAHYQRNHLAYSAGGISIDDKNKYQQYTQIGLLHKKAWEDWARMTKVRLNMEAGFGTVLSQYSYVEPTY